MPSSVVAATTEKVEPQSRFNENVCERKTGSITKVMCHFNFTLKAFPEYQSK